MDPVGPWSAPYNRLTGVQTGAANSELHHHLPFSGSGTKPPAHYAAQVSAQHRQVLAQATSASKQASDGEYHQPQAFFEQGAAGSGTWQQNSPFGILPHESVVNTTASKTVTYENFNAHFVAAQNLNHLNTLVTSNAKNLQRAQSPQVSKPPTSQPNTNTFFQVPISFTSSETNTNSTKSFSSSNSPNLQQSCIVSSPSNTPTSKEYRIPQAPPRAAFLNSSNAARPPEKTYTTSNVKQVPQAQSPQIQTKAQTKIYPDLSAQNERRPSQSEENQQTQSSPISFSTLDSPGRMNYASNNSSAKRSQFQQHSNYRQFQSGNNSEQDFQRPKSGSDYNSSNGSDCNVVVPRRPSPLQAHSQASPLGHAPSPAYPMYNSPMNSISSPQQNANSQVTPPSPLDASVPRPNSQQGGSVAYPSVITRALNSEKNFPERFDRPNQNNQQNCWEDRQQAQQRKFQSNPAVNNYSAANSMDVSNRESQQRAVVLTERQQAYFDSNNTVTLQDLSSCRGDPMTIVKNLQQQSCQIPQQEIKQEVKPPNKRRRSNDKLSSMSPTETPVPTVTDYFPGRIPPPAHSSAANQQQQQNGAYFDFDRWNLPPPPSKIFGTQAAAIHQQHQGIMVPHPHSHHPPPPPLPYFPPFHLPPHPTEFASSSSSVELTPISGSFNDQSSQASSSSAQYSQQEDQPKVVVPNIEEELNFLAEGGSAKPATNIYTRPNPTPNPASAIKPEKLSAPGADFMSSYLKFLQGEKDGSPPPTSRSSRKQTWPRIKAPQTGETSQQQQQQPSQLLKPKLENNGITPNTITPVSGSVPSSSSTLPSIIPAPQITRLSSQGDPQDDPRYFPLPKERKKNMFESSDDGLSSDDDLFPKKTPVVTKQDTVKEKPPKKQKSSKTTNGEKPVSEKKKYRKNSKEGQHGKHEKDRDSEKTKVREEPIVRRETSKRAAKEKSNYKMLAKQAEEDEDAPEFIDSDSDPAWTPQAKEEIEEEAAPKKRRGRKKGSKNFHTTVSKDPVEPVNDTVHVKSKKQKAAGNKHKSSAPTLEDNIAAAVAQQNSIVSDSSSSTDGEGLPFKQGEFVVIKSERNQEWPGIWRVDGKNLLQKYEPFVQNGLTLYKNISTYTSWTPESKKQYVPVEVNVRSQNHLETIVQLARKDVHNLDPDFMAKCIQESETYQDNFEVYIQTLISQALDSNFLTEIFQEQDDYFLSNVKTIDDITESKQKKLTLLLNWPKTVHGAVTTWPCFNVIRDINSSDKVKPCAACDGSTVNARVLMYGQPYNSTTLEGCQPDPEAVNNKDFFMCRWCTSCVDLLNKISHQKYLMYIECAKRVADKRSSDPQKDTTCILNELLADESWLNTLFTKVRQTWAQADCIEYCYGEKKGTKV
ncbi:uncharacterized protein LOC108744837 isoform X2 [Agrilus planipennis]|uniref:Uncharacterized protein LOC108744837 isoform X2 n=1 Tax=Agrilus planipennis TaxID=224129 RepID=A0A7F5R4K0_AGRPL|nr:uncharacterized protein LOC108744837 isoform X2 [Agrilus planipennis]